MLSDIQFTSLNYQLLNDGLFAAIAAIGFGSISNVPIRIFKGCALLAAIGHAMRYLLMHAFGWNIIPAAFIGSLCIGMLAPACGKHWRSPAEALAYPALLPMIPGMYAYRAVEGMLQCFTATTEEQFQHAFFLFNQNGMICVFIVILMVLGVTIPILYLVPRLKGLKTDHKQEKA